MTNEEIRRLAQQADTAQQEALPDTWGYLKGQGYSKNGNSARAVEDMNAFARDAIVAETLQKNVRGLATGSSRVARPESFTGNDLIFRNANLNNRAELGMGRYDQAQGAAVAGGQQQAELGQLMRTRAMGGGPSVAGFQGQAAGDNMVRQMAGAGTGLAAQRGMMLSAAPAIADQAGQVAQARMAEQQSAQQALGANLQAMRGQSMQGMNLATQTGLGYQGVTDRNAFGNAGLEQQAALANQASNEEMRQRQLRELLRQMGDKQAAQAQSMQRTGGLISTAASAGQQIGEAVSSNIAAGKKGKK